MTKVSELKKLALKMTSTESVDDIPGDTIVDVLKYIEENYNETSSEQGPEGPQGPQGIGVKSISLTKDSSGVITGGTCTYTNDETSPITVTTTEV